MWRYEENNFMSTLTAKHPASALVAVVTAAILLNTSPSNQPAAQAAATAFIGVNVLPMDKESVLANRPSLSPTGRSRRSLRLTRRSCHPVR